MKPARTTRSRDATPTKRWERRRDARPGEIAEAALACFTERGFAATKLDDVARRAGVTKGTVYLYFASKEELFKAVVRESLLPRIEGLLERGATTPEDPAEWIRQVMLRFAEEVLPSPAGVLPKLIISEASNFPELARFYHDEVISRVRSLFTDAIRRGVATGRFRPVDADQVVFSFISPMLVAALWRQSFEPYDPHPPDPPAMIALHLDIMFRGLAPDPGPPTDLETHSNHAASAAEGDKRVPPNRKARRS